MLVTYKRSKSRLIETHTTTIAVVAIVALAVFLTWALLLPFSKKDPALPKPLAQASVRPNISHSSLNEIVQTAYRLKNSSLAYASAHNNKVPQNLSRLWPQYMLDMPKNLIPGTTWALEGLEITLGPLALSDCQQVEQLYKNTYSADMVCVPKIKDGKISKYTATFSLTPLINTSMLNYGQKPSVTEPQPRRGSVATGFWIIYASVAVNDGATLVGHLFSNGNWATTCPASANQAPISIYTPPLQKMKRVPLVKSYAICVPAFKSEAIPFVKSISIGAHHDGFFTNLVGAGKIWTGYVAGNTVSGCIGQSGPVSTYIMGIELGAQREIRVPAGCAPARILTLNGSRL